MAEFVILHLYHDLMNLYGEWANVDILVHALKTQGHKASVKKVSVGDNINFKDYNVVYIGSGTEKSQRACMKDLMRHKKAFIKQINNGLYVLATGNSHELFGCAVQTNSGERYKALELLGFETIQNNTRETGDCIYCASFLQYASEDDNAMPCDIIGFVNRAGGSQFDINKDSDKLSEKPPHRPFSVKFGPGAGKGLLTEGIMYKNLFGTYLTGPVLVRNPPLLSYMIYKLTEADGVYDVYKKITESKNVLFCRQEAAYKAALSELLHRAK